MIFEPMPDNWEDRLLPILLDVDMWRTQWPEPEPPEPDPQDPDGTKRARRLEQWQRMIDDRSQC